MAKKQKIIFGIDEVGRGCIAGPVIAAAITASDNFKFQISNSKFKEKERGIFKDSKKMSPKQRETIYDFLKKNPKVEWGIGKVSERIIDKINIFKATKLAMVMALRNLEKKISQQADILLIDGNFGIDIDREQRSIIKGDEKIFLISLASIVAKVERDWLMLKMNQKYPQYGFDKHKGYGTKLHLATLKKFGPSKIHRQSFEPTKSILEQRCF